MWYLLIPRCSFLYHICGIFLRTTKCITYVVSFWYHKRARTPLDVPFPENMVSPDGGERSAAVPCFSLYVNQSSCCLCDGFHWGGNIQSSEFTHIFFEGDVFFGVSFNFMQVMTCDMGTSPGHRRGGLIFCILRGLSSPPHRHISRYLYFNS